MDEDVYALSDQKVFTRELIKNYRKLPVLWKQSHPHYKNRHKRSLAYEVLVQKCREYYPDFDEDGVKEKIDSLRTAFRRQYKKVLKSKEEATTPDEIHIPNLWYYDALSFIVSENNGSDDKEHDISTDCVEDIDEKTTIIKNKAPIWTKERTTTLIDIYKRHKLLYSQMHVHYRNAHRRHLALQKITEDLIEATGQYFHKEDVKRKFQMLKDQFAFEFKKVHALQKRGEDYKPSLWCYDMLNFLASQYSSAVQKKFNRVRHVQMRKEFKESTPHIKEEIDAVAVPETLYINMLENGNDVTSNDDIFDTIAKNVAHKLREMTEEQRNFAEKIVKDVMYHGQMEHLTPNSRFSLDGY